MNRVRSLLVICIALCCATLARAQGGGSGTIEGTINDPSGAVISGASVTATNVDTGVQTTRPSTDAGFYVLTPLPAGRYNVSVTAAGFQVLKQANVVVDALATVGLNLTLQVGSSSQQITVEATPAALHTDDATLGGQMENQQYQALPLAMNGQPRDPTAFVALVPGVSSVVTQGAGTTYASFNGGQQYQNEIYLEGIPLTNAAVQGETRNLSFGISVEAVDQFQVQTNNAKAMYEGQGVENYVLKSGTDQFHGSAYEYFRNTALDARGFFPSFTPIEHQNEFGVNVGGPIKKNKIFFFGSYDGYYYVSSSTPTLQSVPTLAERNGDFSQLLTLASPIRIYDPSTTACSGSICTRQAFPGNIIPANRLSSVSKSLQSYLPAPSNGNLQNNFLATQPIGLHTNNTTDKVDFNLSDKNRFFVLYSQGKYATDGLASISSGVNATPLPYTQSRIVQESTTTAQMHDTYVFTPSVVNELSYSFARLYIPIISATAAGNYPTKAGLAGLPPGQASQAFPETDFTGSNAPISWAGTNARANNETSNTYVLQDNVNWVRGKHSMTFGFQAQWLQDNYINPNTGTLAAFSFAQAETGGFNGSSSIVANTGNAYASYLLGAVDSGSVTDNAVAETGARYHDYAAYIQDDWKVTKKLTLNIGLRYDVWSPFHEVNNAMSFFNPLIPNSAAGGHLGALEFAGNGPDSCNCAVPVKTHYGNFGPRIGAAYQLGDKTVLRGGYAITYVRAGGVGGRVNGRTGLNQLGFDANPSFTSLGSGQPAFYWDSGFPAYQHAPFLNPTYGTGFTTGNPTGALGMTYGDPQIGGKPPYYENWNFSIQRQLTSSTVATAAYTASAGHFLPGAGSGSLYSNIIPNQYLALGSLLSASATPANIAKANAITPGLSLPFSNFQGTIAQMLRPYPQYGLISDPWADVGNSSYNALQLTLNRRFSHGLTAMVGYTFSKELDDLGANRDNFSDRLEKSLGTIDHTHVLQASFAYLLPFGTGHNLGSGNAIIRNIVGGWQLSGIVTFNSGAPLSVTSSNCVSGSILGTCYANYNPAFTGSVRINGNYGDGNANSSTPTVYLNKAAFADPAPYTVGNVPRTAPFGLRAPGIWDTDLSLRREFNIIERIKLSIGADAFNIFNNVYFSAPTTNIDSASFGAVTSQGNSPRKLQLNARVTF